MTIGSDSSKSRPSAGCRWPLRAATPLELVVEAEAVERGEGVGAGEGRDAVDVDADETVGGARAPRRGEVGAARSGKSALAIMPNRSSAQSLKVIC
jgi:hypothetical protein